MTAKLSILKRRFLFLRPCLTGYKVGFMVGGEAVFFVTTNYAAVDRIQERTGYSKKKRQHGYTLEEAFEALYLEASQYPVNGIPSIS